MRFIVVIVSVEEVPVRVFRVASVGVVPQMIHTHLSGCVTRTRGRRLGASQKAISEIREYLIEKNYQSMKREDQQDATIICLLLTSVSKCFGHHYAHLQENKVLTSYKTTPHNRHQPHPAEPEQHTKCSNRAFVLLKIGLLMPETC